MMIDTHCHLSNDEYEDIDVIISHMEDNIMITSGYDKKHNLEVLDVIGRYKNVYGMIGYHPENLDDYDIKLLEEQIVNKKIVAVGEIGLDYHWNTYNKEYQKECFINQIRVAQKYNLPITVHSRDAAADTVDIIEKEIGDSTLVMHCYSYSLEIARRLMKKNVYFGIGGVLTFKNAKNLVEVVKEVPLDRLVLETDSPYLSPEPFRGKKNEPYNILLVAQKIADIKNISVDEVLVKTTQNAEKIFGLNNLQ